MNVWKKNLAPILLAFLGVVLLVLAVLKPVLRGEPVNTGVLTIAFIVLTVAVFSFAHGRKSGGGSGPPSA
jgi:hypothetical protein